MNMPASAADFGAGLHVRYIRKETAIAMLINSVFSAAFVFIVFGRQAQIEFWGAHGLALDFVPQTFIISVMTVSVATLLTRKRVRNGEVPALTLKSAPLPHNTLLRAVLIGTLATILCGGVATAGLALLWNGPYAFNPILVFKVVYGALVAGLVAKIALRSALGDERVDSER